MASRDYFKGKRIAVIGLGRNGEMVEDVKYLIKAGALVSVYDLKSEARLRNHIVFLKTIGLANYICGSVPRDDLLDMDLIVLSHEYPRNSSFLNDLDKPIEYPETLFLKHSPPISIIGIVGSYGKTTLISYLVQLLELSIGARTSQSIFVLDWESDRGILSCLKKIKGGDIVLMKIGDRMVEELRRLKISPQIIVFTSTLPSHLVQDSPFEIANYQTYNNFIVGSDLIIDTIHSLRIQPKAKMARVSQSLIPAEWSLSKTFSKAELLLIALALQTAMLFKVGINEAKKVVLKLKSLKGRRELVRKLKGVYFYNDTGSINPLMTEMALITLASGKNAVLIMGGSDTKWQYDNLYKIIPQYVHTIILLPGSGTIRERHKISMINDINILSAPSLEEAVRKSLEHAKKGDIVLFSPGFEFQFEGSRKERGERFVRAVRNL